MDVAIAKKYFSLENLTSIFKETSLCDNPLSASVSDGLRLDKCGDSDALQTVKLDPAVLEARLTLRKRAHSESVNTPQNHNHAALAFKNEYKGQSSLSSSSSSSSFKERSVDFESMLSMQKRLLGSITPEQLALLLKYVKTLRQQREALHRSLECAFCKQNGEPAHYYTSHSLKDWRGRVLCPVLRAFSCPRCGATGDRAHTIKYCPENADNHFRTKSRRCQKYGY